MRTGGPAEQPSPKNTVVREGVLCLWFVLTGAAFWGTYAGLSLAAPLTAFYGVFVVAVAVLLALRLLRGNSGGSGARAAGRKTERRG